MHVPVVPDTRDTIFVRTRQTIAIASILALAATGCGGDDSSEFAVATVQLEAVSQVIDSPGTVAAKSVSTVNAPASGAIRALPVAEGAKVHAGEILAVIDSPDTVKRLDLALRALDAANGVHVDSGSSVDLTAGLEATDGAAVNTLARARAAAALIPDPGARDLALAQLEDAQLAYTGLGQQARATADSVQSGLASMGQAVEALAAAQRMQAQLAVELAQSQVDALTVLSPTTGIVQYGGAAAPAGADVAGLLSQVAPGLAAQAAQFTGAAGLGAPSTGDTTGTLALGGQVSAGSAIATVVDLSEFSVVAQVDESDVFHVTPGLTADVELDAAPGAHYDAVVRSVDVMPTSGSQGGVGYRVRLQLGKGTLNGEAAPTPRPGMSAIAKIDARKANDAITVPPTAIVHDGDRDVVWLLDGEKALRREVTLGAQGKDAIQVLSGVSPGDRVVARGADKVKPGQQIP